jgi:hypothetical protein
LHQVLFKNQPHPLAMQALADGTKAYLAGDMQVKPLQDCF